MIQHITIPGRLPGWNEMNTGQWYIDRRIKGDAMTMIEWLILSAKIKAVGRAEIKIICYEPNKRRDPSNVRAGAEKIILDALQNAKIIKNDNWQWLEDTPASVELDRKNPRVEIEIRSKET